MSVISSCGIITPVYYATEGSSVLELLQTSSADLVGLIIFFFPWDSA